MDTQTKCSICGHDSTHHACRYCETRMTRLLKEIGDYAQQAAHELTPGKTGSDQRGSETSIGIRISALDLIAGNDVLPILESWERDWRDTYQLQPYGIASSDRNAGKPRAHTLTTVLDFLTTWLPRACETHPAIEDFNTELKQAHATAQQAARMTPPNKTTITCPNDDDTTPTGLCGSRITIHADSIDGKATCRRCRTTWDIAHLIHVAITTPGAETWTDSEAAANYFGISVRTLNRWAKAKHGCIKRREGKFELQSIHAAIDRIT
jgi:hypothetical protein